jgi:NOL1/NOP2/fmu family ribosome biogenesis protein
LHKSKLMQQQQDPLTQIQQRELSLKEAEFEHKKQLDIAKLQADIESKASNVEVQKDRLQSEEKREGARLGVKVATETDKARREDIKQGIELGREMAKDLVEIDDK